MDFSETRAGAAREIALAFGVPPLLLGLPGDNTFANYQEANRAFWRQTVIPLVGRLQNSFAAWLAPGYGALRFEANLDSIDALAEERAREWRRIGDAAFLTRDEQREAAGYGPAPKDARDIAGGDAGAAVAPELRYRPDQPRAPAGASDGGRWVAEGGGGSGRNFGVSWLNRRPPGAARSDATQPRVAMNISPNLASDAGGLIHQVGDKEHFTGNKYPVDLADEEARGGHAIARHVNRSTEQLIMRANRNQIGFGNRGAWEDRVGSFTSILAANNLVNATIQANNEVIRRKVIASYETIRIEAWFEQPTGYESYRRRLQDPAVIRTTYGVKVVLRPDSRTKNGFRILTAYPINKEGK